MLRLIRWNRWLELLHNRPTNRTNFVFAGSQFANILLPFKSGDLIRLFRTSHSMFDFSSILVCLLIERLFDVAALIIISSVFFPGLAQYYLVIGAGVTSILLLSFFVLKKRKFSFGPFNSQAISWSIHWVFKSRNLLKQMRISILMWIMYMTSDICLANYFTERTDINLSKIFEIQFTIPTFNRTNIIGVSGPLLAGMSLFISILALSNLFSINIGVIVPRNRFEYEAMDEFVNLNFEAQSDIKIELLKDDEEIVEIFRGGSHAITMWLQNRSQNRDMVRKYARWPYSDTLLKQYVYMNLVSTKSGSPCAPELQLIIDKNSIFAYEMEFFKNSETLTSRLSRIEEMDLLCQQIRNAWHKTFKYSSKEYVGNFSEYSELKLLRLESEIHRLKLKSFISSEDFNRLQKSLASIRSLIDLVQIAPTEIIGHGDFSDSNILISKNEIYFIDMISPELWGNYLNDVAKLFFTTLCSFQKALLNGDRQVHTATEIVNLQSRIFPNYLLSEMVPAESINELIMDAIIHLVSVMPYRFSENLKGNLYWIEFFEASLIKLQSYIVL